MIPEQLIWALECFPSSFVEIKAKNAEEVSKEFEVHFRHRWADAYQALVKSINTNDLSPDYFPQTEEECCTIQIEVDKESAIAIFEPLLIPYCYGDFCEVYEACLALDETVKDIQENYPDSTLSGLVAFPWSDRRCGDIVCYQIGEEKTVYPIFADILNEAVKGKTLFGTKIEWPDDDFSFAAKLTEAIIEAYEADVFRDMITFIKEYNTLLSKKAKSVLKQCVLEALDSIDEEEILQEIEIEVKEYFRNTK